MAALACATALVIAAVVVWVGTRPEDQPPPPDARSECAFEASGDQNQYDAELESCLLGKGYPISP